MSVYIRSIVTALSVLVATLSFNTLVDAKEKHPTIVETAVQAGSFKTLVAALKATDLVKPLNGKGPFTVFAPTDEAFAKLPKGTVEKLLLPENKGTLAAILKYHVVPGKVMAKDVVKVNAAKTLNGQRVDVHVKKGKVKIDNAKVIKTDILASNGVIHVIDSIVMPSTLNIIQTAGKAGSFKTLAAALKAAKLVKTINGKGPFTVFAPTDNAFAKLPEGTVEQLVQPENIDKLKAILTYHVVPGRVFSSDLKNGMKAKTVHGYALNIKICKTNGVSINNAKVVKADIDATNGVIHVIDTVLIPTAKQPAIQ